VQRIVEAAKFMRKASLSNPAPYLMLRGLRWGEVRASGASINPKLLEAPSTAIRTQLKTLLLESKWPLLLEACEIAMGQPCGRGWLDLQRYAVTACSRLGGEYARLQGALQDALRGYVHDVPRILEMTMMDDTPTANAETQEWLEQEIGTSAAPVSRKAKSVDPAGADEALALARGGQTAAAIALVNEQLAHETSARGRFRCKTQLAAVLMEAGQEAIALPILEQLAAQIDNYKLEEWESGEVVAEPLALYVKCLHKLDGDPSTRQALYLRVCRLDPLRALTCPQ
jgi:type VI secretion system protein ImpA